MHGDFVTLEQARRLAALRFPQDRWPQMVWRDTLVSVVPVTWDWIMEQWEEWGQANRWYAAPVYVAGDGVGGALDWCERGHEWRWKRILGIWGAEHGKGISYVAISNYESASGLLDAILNRLEAAPPAAKEEETMTDIETALRREHQHTYAPETDRDECRECGDAWPCPAIQLADELARDEQAEAMPRRAEGPIHGIIYYR